MIAIAVVLGIAVLVEGTWPGSIITNAPWQRPARLRLRAIHRSVWAYGWFGRLAWLGMWCGLVGAIGLFVGVPWAAHEQRAARESKAAVEQELVKRQCGDLLPIPPSHRMLDGIVRGDPEVREDVARRWREYEQCRARALGQELPRRGWQNDRQSRGALHNAGIAHHTRGMARRSLSNTGESTNCGQDSAVTASDLVQHESERSAPRASRSWSKETRMSEERGIYYAGAWGDRETRDEQEKKALAADGVAIS